MSVQIQVRVLSGATINFICMKIYISLPITGQEEEAREKACHVKAMLSGAGHNPVSPFDIYAGEDAEYFDYICADLRVLADCDAIFLCEGWQFSKGCTIEATFANTYGKQIMTEKQ